MKTILLIVGGIVVSGILLFIYCCMRLSSEISKKEKY